MAMAMGCSSFGGSWRLTTASEIFTLNMNEVPQALATYTVNTALCRWSKTNWVHDDLRKCIRTVHDGSIAHRRSVWLHGHRRRQISCVSDYLIFWHCGESDWRNSTVLVFWMS